MSPPPPVILVVEDHPYVRSLLRDLLELAACRVETAASGSEAIQRAAAGGIDLILLDQRLPDMEGHDVCRRLVAPADQAPFPVVVLSADTEAIERAVMLTAGARDYLPKPFDVDDLWERLPTWLDTAPPLGASDSARLR